MQDSHAIDEEQTGLIETPKRESHGVTDSLIASCLGRGAGAGAVVISRQERVPSVVPSLPGHFSSSAP